ncbi:hypothetical protein HK104_011276 [Borealophlyctis nickersoniae]|nr:hypothetical protein HK104_011276 [Borealophlyctis nickersoniae]
MPVEPKIAPSMLSSDFACLADEANRMIGCGADCLHMDVMDGHFVPNITLGAPIIKSLRKHTDAFLDCHMMVTNPEKVNRSDTGACAAHYESTEDASALIDRIHAAGMKAGVAVKPGTPVDVVFPLAHKVDQVLIMTVEPGFGGQKFMEHVLPKVETLRSKYPDLDIEVDGGLGPENVDKASSAGANVIVAGTSVFGSPDPKKTIEVLRESVLKKGARQ